MKDRKVFTYVFGITVGVVLTLWLNDTMLGVMAFSLLMFLIEPTIFALIAKRKK